MSRVSKVILVASLLVPSPAGAEVPRTAAAWLAVYRERQARFDAVEIESHWQRLSGEDVVEEWDQIFYADDLGRLRLAELGRLEQSPQRQGVTFITDSLLAFDGGQYLELVTRWESPERATLSSSAVAALRQSPAKVRQCRIDSEAGEQAAIRRADTPFKACDHWFLACLKRAVATDTPLRVEPVGEGDLWKVSFDSSSTEWGHKSTALVRADQDNHVVRVELWAGGKPTTIYEATYAPLNDRWVPASGRCETAVSHGAAPGWRFSVTGVTSGRRMNDEAILPVLPVGAVVWDRRTDANYRVGDEEESERTVGRLTETARVEISALEKAASRSEPARLRRLLVSVGIGFIIGAGIDRARRLLAKKSGLRDAVVGGAGRKGALSREKLGAKSDV